MLGLLFLLLMCVLSSLLQLIPTLILARKKCSTDVVCVCFVRLVTVVVGTKWFLHAIFISQARKGADRYAKTFLFSHIT